MLIHLVIRPFYGAPINLIIYMPRALRISACKTFVFSRTHLYYLQSILKSIFSKLMIDRLIGSVAAFAK